MERSKAKERKRQKKNSRYKILAITKRREPQNMKLAESKRAKAPNLNARTIKKEKTETKHTNTYWKNTQYLCLMCYIVKNTKREF